MSAHSRIRQSLAAAAVVLLAVTGAACSSETPTPRDVIDPNAQPGDLLADPSDLATIPAIAGIADRAVKVRYRSTSGIDDSATEVSGTVFVPEGDPPRGGWPIASIGHPTAGLSSQCAPSSYPSLLGSAGVVASFLTFGFVVTMSDYQGLGSRGPHPYLEPKTAAYNVIDAVRAAREVEPRTSGTWMGYGVSQGGQAVWAANELAADYGPELSLIGTMSIAPATDLRPLVDAMEDGTLTVAQKVLMPSILRGLHVAHPEIRVEDYLHGEMERRVDAFSSCENQNSGLKGMIAEAAPPEDFRPLSPEAAKRLRDALGADAVPSGPASAPMLVAYGDEDETVLPQWTVDAVARGCALGDIIQVVVAPGQGHGTLDLGSVPLDWTRARLAGLPAPDTCPSSRPSPASG